MKKRFIPIIYVIIDFIIIFSISILSFFSVYEIGIFNENTKLFLIFCGLLAFIGVIIFGIFKLYKTQITTFGIGDLVRLALCTTGLFAVSLIILLVYPKLNFDLKYIFSWTFSFASILLVLALNRTAPRIFKIIKNYFLNKNRVRTLIIGAGDAAKIIIDDSRNNPDSMNKIVVLLDDNRTKFHTIFSNIPVEGPVSNACEIIKKYQIEEVVIAISNLSPIRLREILGYLKDSNVRVKRMPLLTELTGPNDKKVIDVDIDELLNRDPIKLDNHEVKEMLTKKVVLVTGAGGSIGSELTRQIFKAHPSKLIIFDIYENNAYDIQQELIRKMRAEDIRDIELITLIGSTYNEKRMEQVIRKYKPDYIYHAAAYKHVPLMEDSPAEAIRTNVIGTYNVAKLADKYKVRKMVLVSTDKAVRPTNTMGATKRFAETIIQYFSEKSKNTAYSAVRFGNVLGSNGSVVPLFKKQIEEGGPITLTHKDIIRYFMTIPEAVSLILQCGLYAEGGEIFILDMGEPVKIYDLAVKLIRCAGLVPGKDIEIKETGLRPGEKLFEELLLDTKTQKRTANKRIFIEEKETIKPIEEEIKTISKAFDIEEAHDVKVLLKSIIETYTITESK